MAHSNEQYNTDVHSKCGDLYCIDIAIFIFIRNAYPEVSINKMKNYQVLVLWWHILAAMKSEKCSKRRII